MNLWKVYRQNFVKHSCLLSRPFPKLELVVAIDIGDAHDIHPRNKQDVGERLALVAMAIAYRQKIVYSCPIYRSMRVEGSKVRIFFDHVGSGLLAKDGELKGFAIAGKDKKFVWAKAKIEGETVLVWSEQVSEPVAVRYAWADKPHCNLYNKEGLPALPFRTDDVGRCHFQKSLDQNSASKNFEFSQRPKAR